MNKLGQIITEVWDEWMKDPKSHFYCEVSKETFGIIFSELEANMKKDKAIFHDPVCKVGNLVHFVAHLKERSPSSVMSSIMTEITIYPCIGKIGEDFKVHLVEATLMFLRNDNLPKGKVVIRKKLKGDRFI